MCRFMTNDGAVILQIHFLVEHKSYMKFRVMYLILEEVMQMAVDCLAGYIHTCRMDGDEIPDPSPMDQIDINAIAKEYDSPSDEM